MGRHRSTLRELGWGISNSPNPFKQGSAKRVVRTLDYSAAENEEPTVLPSCVAEQRQQQQPQQQQQQQPSSTSATSGVLDEKLAQLQQDGRQQLDRIREQFEAQEAESKRKLDRLNGRIAELGEGKRALWSAFQGASSKPAGAEASAVEGDKQHDSAASASSDAAALAKREVELSEKAAALDKAEADANAKAQAAAAQQEKVEVREAAVLEREKAVAIKEAKLAELEAKLGRTREQLEQREHAVRAREQTVAAAAAAASSKLADDAAASSLKQQQQQQEPAEASSKVAEEARAAEEASKKAKEEEQRSKVRFDKAAAAAKAESSAASKPAVGGASASTAMASSKSAVSKESDGREIQFDQTADWVRSENLTASLMRQRAENPEEVFYPLPHQRTCELADIFSAPRRRERGKGSGDWTPVQQEEAAASARTLFGSASSKPSASAQPANALQLLGVDGEYMSEILPLSLLFGPGAPSKTIVVGRSSSCDVTLSRDDQISRKHMEIVGKDGKLYARDLGSTYGTRLNGKSLVQSEPLELKPGDVLVLGASSFQLQVGGK